MGGVMGRPRLLDAFSGAGGAGMGYSLAGFDVVGVDIKHQKNYPFEFHQGDAIEFIREHGHEFDAIHASPPCQAYTSLQALHKHIERDDLLAATRTALRATGRPWAIENVIGAPIQSGVFLCGTMFGLRVYRHRWFETPFMLMQPEHPKHLIRANGPGGKQQQRKAYYEAGGFITITGDVGSYCGPAMGITWMTGNELSQAIPPPYTRWVGARLLEALEYEEAAS
jgi:DNA (cytosine-5)-methyltransferase 1